MVELAPSHFVLVAASLFAVGAAGAILRRNALTFVMSVELMLNAANILFVAYAKQYGDPEGHVIAILVLAIAVAEAAVGLAILSGVHRTRGTVDLDELDALRDEA